MNIVALVGNLTTEPELRHLSTGHAVCTFRLAVSRPRGEAADVFTVVTTDRQAEVCAEYLAQGRRIAIEGRLRGSVREERSVVEVVASRVELLGRGVGEI